MAIEFGCPTCGGTLRVGDEAGGRVVRCGGCMTTVRVPDVPPPATDEPESFPYEPDRIGEPQPTGTPDDEGPRPRPRRRRPPPPKGRGPVFWILLTFGILAVGALALCGGVLLFLPKPAWRTHESARGGYKVELPAPPRDDMEKRLGVPPKDGVTVEGTVFGIPREEFAVVWNDLPAGGNGPQADRQVIEAAVRVFETGADVARVARNEPLTVSGFPAREVEVLMKGGGTVVTRVVLADSRLYVVTAGGRSVRSGNARVRRFLDSFEVIDPKLVAVAKQRADQARLAAEAIEQVRKREEKRRERERILEEEARRQEELEKVAEAGAAVGAAIWAAVDDATGPPEELDPAAAESGEFSFFDRVPSDDAIAALAGCVAKE
jgi:hypothetical protein